VPTITTSDLEVVFPKSEKDRIDVEELKSGTEILALKSLSDLKTTVFATGVGAFTGQGVSNSKVVLESTKKNTDTPKFVLANKNFSQSEIKIVGNGKGKININTGAFRNSTIKGGKKNDSIRFGNESIVNNNSINLGKGGDSITFKPRTTFKGKTTINLVKGGKDVVKFGKNPNLQKGAKVVIKNFDKQDKLIVGKNTFNYNDIKRGSADIPGKIEIRLV